MSVNEPWSAGISYAIGAGLSAIVHAAHEFAALTLPPVVGAAGSYAPEVQLP